MRDAATRLVAAIRIDAIWLAVDPMDMRASSDTALARVVNVWGGAPASRAPFTLPRRAFNHQVQVSPRMICP